MRTAAIVLALMFPAAAGATPPAFTFSTGNTDGKMAMASRPDGNAKAAIEAADDFPLARETQISGATVTGLLAGATSSDVERIEVEIYRVFPLDSDTGRTPNVPTRANSPSDNVFATRDSAGGSLSFTASTLNASFVANNSVLNGIHAKPNQLTGGEGSVGGQEVRFDLTFSTPIDLPAGQYFLVPQVQVAGSGNFYWLSAPKPIVAPGTPFTSDLQAWIRNAALEPDWLRVGTDIVGAGTFNATFSLAGTAVCRPLTVDAVAPDGRVGAPYAGSFTASGGTSPDTLSVTGLPPGLAIGTDGAVSGTPTQAGTFAIAAAATDAEGCRTTRDATITIAAAAAQQPGGGGATPAMLSKLFLKPARFRAAKGSHLHFTLSAAAAVKLRLQRRVSGHYVLLKGTLTKRGRAGANVVRFTARLQGHRLRRGRYRLVAAPDGGVAKRTAFRII